MIAVSTANNVQIIRFAKIDYERNGL